jgi:hypothetical protein
MINFIIENQSLIKSYMDEDKEYDAKRLYINQNKIWNFFCTPPELYNQLRKYYGEMNENELYLAIRRDFVSYTLDDTIPNEVILKEMNYYLDSILREGESVATSKWYWSIVFSNSFYDYSSVTIFYNHSDLIYVPFTIQLELVFLFDEQNRIKMVNICLLIP